MNTSFGHAHFMQQKFSLIAKTLEFVKKKPINLLPVIEDS